MKSNRKAFRTRSLGVMVVAALISGVCGGVASPVAFAVNEAEAEVGAHNETEPGEDTPTEEPTPEGEPSEEPTGESTDEPTEEPVDEPTNTLTEFELTAPDGIDISQGDPVKGDEAVFSVGVQDAEGLDSYKITVDGSLLDEKSFEEDEDTITLDLSSVDKSGKVDVEVTILDREGNDSVYLFSVVLDNNAPEVDKIELSGTYTEKGGVLYGPQEGIKGSITVTDAVSGVSKVELVAPSGVKTVEDGEFTLDENGTYSFRLTDKVGNTVDVALSDLGLPNTVELSDSKPQAEIQVNGVPNTGNWYTDTDVTIKGIFSDMKGLKIVELWVNDKKVDGTLGLGSAEVEVNIADIAVPDDGIYDVTARVVNLFGNHTDVKSTVKVDWSDPVVSGVANYENSNVEEEGVFTNDSIPVSLTVSDQGSGVASVVVNNTVNGKTIAEEKGNVGTLNFNIEESGTYSVKVIDVAGHSVVRELSEVLQKTEVGNIIVDKGAPTLEVVNPLSEGVKVGEKVWFSQAPEDFNLSVGDNNFKKVTVEANGEKVWEGTAREGYTSQTVRLEGVKPNADGSVEVKVTALDKARNEVTETFTYYIDSTAPTAGSIVFTTAEGGAPAGKIKDAENTGNWGYFFREGIHAQISVSDQGASSGIKDVVFRLNDGNEQSVPISGGTADVPLGLFKGFVSAYVVDNVGNKSEVVSSNGVIAESTDVHVNTARLSVNLPEPVGTDIAGNDLYKSAVPVHIVASDSNNGLEKIEWTSNLESLGGTQNLWGGETSPLGVTSTDKNIVTGVDGVIQATGDLNGIELNVTAEDNAGNVSTARKVFSIDTTAPVITVSYNTTNDSGIYNQNRVATITITDVNFDPSNVVIGGTAGSLSTWQSIGGNSWVAEMVFSEDMEYQWSIRTSDRAGNESNVVDSGKFIIDQTAPEMSVVFDNNNARNGNFYKDPRTATVTVIDRNFTAGGVTASGTEFTGWTSAGDTHRATATFGTDGEYAFNVSVVDEAGNQGGGYESGEFIIDTTAPTLNVEGVTNGASYRKGLEGSVSFEDKYLDGGNSTVTLTTRGGGTQDITGAIAGNRGSFFISNPALVETNDDVYSLTASVMDMAGNESVENVVWNVNRFGSKFLFLNEDYLGKYMQKVTEDVVVRETNVEELDLESGKVVVIRNGVEKNIPIGGTGQGVTVDIKDGDADTSKKVYDYSIPAEEFKTDGHYLVQVYSKTKSGTENSSLSTEYSFIVDSEKPKIIVTGVKDGETYNASSRRVVVEARDSSGVSGVEVLLDGKAVRLDDDGAFTIDAKDGVQSIEVSAVDKAGNVQTETIDGFRVTESVVGGLLDSWVVKAVAGVLGALAVLILIILGKKKRDNDKERSEREELRNALVTSTGGE